jgi:hypothetical protein
MQNGCRELGDAAWASERIESFTETTAHWRRLGWQDRELGSSVRRGHHSWDLSETTRLGLTTHDRDSTTAAATGLVLLDCL